MAPKLRSMPLRLLLILLFSSSLFAQITVESAWQRVLSENDGLKASKADITHSTLKQESAEGMYLPSISLTANYTHLNDPIGFDTTGLNDHVNSIIGSLPIPLPPLPGIPPIEFLGDDIAFANINLLYPLYMGGKIDAAQDAYAGKVAEAKAKHRIAEDKAFLTLIKYYYGLVMTKSLLQTREEAQKGLQLHYAHAVKLKAQGQISQAELLNAKVKLDIAKIETTKAKHKVDIVNSAFEQLIKQKNSPRSPLFVNTNVGSRYNYTRKSVENYAAIDMLNAKSKQASAMIDIEEAAWKPEVVGYGTYNIHKGDSLMEEMAPTWMVGVGLKFELFSRKDRAKEVEAAKVMRAKVASLTAQAKEDLNLAVRKTYNELLLYRDEFNSLSSSIALAKENYRLRTLAFKEGLATSVEVVDAQMLLSGAKTQRFNAAYNYVKRLAEICVLSGDRDLFFKIEKSSKRIK